MGKQGAKYHLELAVDGLTPLGGWSGRRFVLSPSAGEASTFPPYGGKAMSLPLGLTGPKGREVEGWGQVWKAGGGEEEEEEEEKRVSIESKVRPACTLISKLGFSLAK